MKLMSESEEFQTLRRIYFKGKEGEEGGGAATLTIRVEGITTEDMVKQLEGLASDVASCIKKIVAAQEAPQQFFEDH